METRAFHALYDRSGPPPASALSGLKSVLVNVALGMDDDVRAMFNGYATDVPGLALVPSATAVSLTHSGTGRRLVQCPRARIWPLLLLANHMGTLVDWSEIREPADLRALPAETLDRLRTAVGTFAERNQGEWVRGN